MTVFKTFWKILNKNKFMIILYTVILLGFAASNMQTSEKNINFEAVEPSILIVNNDKEEGITKDFIKYIKENSKTPDIENTEEARDDAIFYTDADYIVYIPENYNKDFLEGKNPEIKVKAGTSYNSSYSEMLVTRYINVANMYQRSIESEEEIINKINETLSKEAEVEITSKLDTGSLSKATYYYNFANYSLLACLIFIIGLILCSFNEENVRKRTIISSTDHKTHNRMLLLSNGLYSLILWLFYVIMSFVLVGNIMFSMHGLIYIINSFILTICVTTISFFIGNVVNNKNALSGIVNVVSLGSSFLCGAFVPMRFLPDTVIKIAHVLPTYYYIRTNEALTSLEVFNFETMKPLLTNMGILLGFSIVFIILTNIVSKKKRRIG